jgi:hypothetical protein
VPYPGSQDTLTLAVDPYDGTTAATLTIAAPGGSTLAPTATSSDGGRTWVAHPVYAVAGRHVVHWHVTGTGAGETEGQPGQEIWVSQPSSPAAAVAWRPELWHVADYVPGRTLVGAVDGYGNALQTFDNTTHPTGSSVQRLITAGCSWVLMKTGALDPAGSLDEAARATAAVYTAYAIERGYPDNSREAATASDLWQQANQMRDDLHAANVAVTGTDTEDPNAALLPEFSFPKPCAWGDWVL